MSGLPVTCPGCDASYLLPRSLMGERGARVTCPTCGQEFAVTPGGAITDASTLADHASQVAPLTPGPARAAAPPRPQPRPAGAEDAPAIARAVLEELSRRLGPAIEQAARDQRLFASHGPDLFAAFDEFRRRAGAQAGTEAFREALRARWGVDLFPSGESRG